MVNTETQSILVVGSGMSGLTAAIEAAEAAGVPVMVHTAPPPPSTEEYLPRLRSGDIVIVRPS